MCLKKVEESVLEGYRQRENLLGMIEDVIEKMGLQKRGTRKSSASRWWDTFMYKLEINKQFNVPIDFIIKKKETEVEGDVKIFFKIKADNKLSEIIKKKNDQLKKQLKEPLYPKWEKLKNQWIIGEYDFVKEGFFSEKNKNAAIQRELLRKKIEEAVDKLKDTLSAKLENDITLSQG